MDDVVSAQLENENLRKIRARLLRWEAKNNPLATLSNKQDEYLETIESICNNDNTCKVALLPPQNNDAHLDGKNAREVEVKPKVQMQFPCNSMEKLQQLSLTQSNGVDTTQNFLLLFDQVQDEIYEGENMPIKSYLQQLISRRDKCIGILNQIQEASQCLQTLKDEYTFVSEKTEHLNKSSEQLIEEQKILQNITDDIQHRLYYYNQVELLQQRLFSPTLSVTSEAFQECLCKMDECLNYLKEHPQYKETAVFTIKYKHCLNKAITLLRNYIHAVMAQCTEATLHTKQTVNQNSSNETSNHAVMSATTTMANTPDTTFALYYGKYQIASVKIKRIIQMIELRIGKSIEYTHLLNDLQQNYVQQRSTIMKPAVNKAINDIKVQHKSDHCVLMRKACAFLVHICQDEHRLYYQFFIKDSDQLNTYLESLCNILYDMMRPFVIHINHLETLAEICSILRIEMLEEHVQQNPTALETFGTVINQLLQDVQERLVFRAYLYLQSDILNYNPSAGDLAYPEKLEMMESIALSLQESSKIQRSDSRSSLISTISQNTDIASVDSSVSRIRAMNSPADLHGMWYPTVRRTLVCLSRLYRCVDRPIFQGLSQEALKLCIQSVAAAANKISQAKTSIDGELFEIKHMLILREQIAPFRVDFTIKETSLDFSKVKTAAFTLLQKRNQLFTMGSNNALLEFLLEGTPQIKEHMLDSRKAVDRQLKLVCERFIQDAVKELIGPLLKFLEHAEELLEQTKDDDDDDDDSGGGGGGGEGGEDGEHNRKSNNIENYGKAKQMIKKINYNLRQSSWASPQQISSVIQEAQRLIKKRLPSLQYSMQLYLSNRDTEFIIFRPIRNNVIQNFMKLEQLLNSNSYSSDDMIIASCPSTEQISILLSNTSILTAENVNNFSQQQHHHHQQQQQQQQQLLHSKKSENNIDPNRNDNSMKMSEAQNKNSLEKKVNFDSQTYQQQEQVQAETIVSVTSDSATSIH